MGPISISQTRQPAPRQEQLFLGSLLVLPFASYLGLLGLVGLLLNALVQRGAAVGRWLWQRGYGWLTIGLIASAAFAVSPGDAWLQLANFLPYFLLAGTLHTAPQLARPVAKLTQTARALVLGSIPVSLIALVEYTIRFPAITARVGHWPMFQWVYDVSFLGHRAQSTLSYPNILGNYLVIVVGLGLGLLVGELRRPRPRLPQSIATALVLANLAVFCTGSRNALLAVMPLLLVAGYLARRRPWVWWVGLITGIAATLGILVLGIGGRSLSIALFTNDPRVLAWQIALDFIQPRPLLGWGLGGFNHIYVPFSIPEYKYLFHPHNLWLYLACDTGIPVMVLFCWIVGRQYVRGVRRLSQLQGEHQTALLSYLLAFSGCILFALYDVTLFDARINILSWFALASIGVLTECPRSPNGQTDGPH